MTTFNILSLVKYWYFRYLLTTELYMVEKWERVMIHIVFFILFSFICVLNSRILLNILPTIPTYFQNFPLFGTVNDIVE